MSITTKLFPHSLIGIVSVLPALLVMPASAEDIVYNEMVRPSNGEPLNIGQDGDIVTITASGDAIRAISAGNEANAVPRFVNITADTINITSNSAGGDAGIWIQNNTSPAAGATSFSTVNLTANDINISSPNGGYGVTVMSQGRLNINGNTTITSNNDAILTRGFAQTRINSSGENTVKMTGNIDFNFDKDSSGTPIDALVDVKLNGAESFWTGNTVVSYDDGVPSEDAAYMDVSDATITLQNGATWNATKINDLVDYYYTALNNLNVNDGNVNITNNDMGRGVTVENLTANGLNISGGDMTVSKSLTGTGNHTTVNAGAKLTVDATEGASFVDIAMAGDGGAIVNGGTLSLNNTLFDGNSGAYGGAIENMGTITATNSTFSDNVASVIGGAIDNYDGNVTLVNGVVRDNQGMYGGGISNSGSLTVNGTIFEHNVATDYYGGAIASKGSAAALTGEVKITNGNFYKNAAPDVYQGGAIFLQDSGNVTIKGSTFGGIDESDPEHPVSLGNMAGVGGAIYVFDTKNATHGETSVVITSDNSGRKTIFDHNAAKAAGQNGDGGAIVHNGYKTFLDLSNSEFTNNSAISQGGALTITSTAGTQRANTLASTINNVLFANNTTGVQGGAAWIGARTEIRNSEFKSNTSTTEDDGVLEAGGGALYVGGGATVSIFDTDFSGNESAAYGGAISTRGVANSGASALNVTGGTIDGNIAALDGGAIWTEVVTNITDTDFTNNTAGGNGGAISHTATALDRALTVSAVSKNVAFSGNTANGVANDIYNTGVLNFNAASGKTISLAGGINGVGGTTNITGAGVVNTSTIKSQTVNVNAGELRLNDADLTGSTVAVNSGATLNSIDSLANDYSSFITLNDGASIALDIDFNTGDRDVYTIADNANIAITNLNLLSALNGDVQAKDLQIAEKGNINVSAVADTVKAYTSTAVFGLVGNGDANNGTISLAKTDDVVSGTGLVLAATNSATKEQSYFQMTADESVATDQTVSNEFAIAGDGTGAGDAGVGLDATLTVADNSMFTADNTKFEGTGSIDTTASAEFIATNSKVDVDVNNEGTTTFTDTTFAAGNTFTNALGATTTLLDSIIHGTFRNFGIVHSDPTTIAGLYDNVGYTDFDNDTFDTTAELRNTGTVDLKNSVTFESGATITGAGLINLASGTTHFNNTASNNTLKLASGAKFDGTLASTGVLDTRNANIDTGLGTVTGGDLYVDANLVAGSIDSFAATTGANVKGIKLANAGYGTSNKVELDFGGATLDGNLEVEGTNYFTKVTKDGDNIVFSDKLINESNLDAKLGSWTGGTYIKANSDMTHAADGTTYLNVGQALKALDTQVKTNTDTIATKADSATTLAGYGITDAYTKDAVDTALAGKQASLTDAQMNAANSGITAAKVATYDGYADTIATKADSATTLAGYGITDAYTKDAIDTALAGKAAIAGGNAFTGAQTITNTSDVADAVVSGITVTASNTTDSKSNVFAVTSDAVTVNGNAVLTTTSALNGANLSAGSVGTAALTNGAVTLDKIADAAMVQGTGDYATSTQLTSKGYVDQALATNTATITGVSDRVTTLENAGYQTATQVNTAIANATITQSQVTGLTDALDEKASTTALNGVSDRVTTLENAGYQTATQVNTAIANATITQSQVTGLTDALDEKASTTALNGVSDRVTTLENAGYQTATQVNTAIANATITQNQVTGLTDAFDSKQDSLTGDQLAAANSGITADKVSTYDEYATAISGHTTAITKLNADAETEGSVDYKIANALSTMSSSGAISNAIDDKIAAAVENNGTVATAIQTATNMGATDGNNYDANDSVVAAIEAIDTNVGKVHGLVTNDNDGVTRIHGTRTSGDYVAKNVDANTGAYTGNLAIGTTIEDHLISLDNTIGSMSTLDTSNGVLDNTASVAQNLQNLDTALANVRVGSLADANAYTDRRVESLDKNLSSGVAGAVALSSVAVSGVERGEVSVGAGYGYFNGQSAAAFGAAMGLSNRWSVNAGAGISNADVSFRAGTNYKFKLF